MSAKKKADDPTYADLSAELETILDEIESGEIDLDALSNKVERAATLLALCRKRLAATETKVKQVTEDLQDSMAQSEEPEEQD